jgi:autotransporter family porin
MKLLLIVVLALSLGLAQKCLADSYEWDGGGTGDFSTMNWYDVATFTHHVGPPGGGDSADVGGADITLDSGTVMELQGESATLDCEGPFTAKTLNRNVTIVGTSPLNVGTLIAYADINGGNVMANSVSSSELEIDGGGSLTVSGTFTDHRYLESSGVGSTITANGGMTDVNLTLSSGCHLTAASILNLLGSSGTVQGDGTLVSVTGDFALAEGAVLDIASNATLQVGGNLSLDGGTTFTDGGATISDPGTTVQVNGVLTIGNSKGEFFFNVDNGAQLTSSTAFIGDAGSKLGYATLSGSNTIWTVQAVGLAVGAASAGDLTINGGAGLVFGGDTAFGIGFYSGSSGTLVLDGAGSYIDASGAYTSIGLDAGSQGTMQIQNQARMVAGADFYVGDGGLGSLNISSGQLTVTGTGTVFDIGHQANANGSVSISGGAALRVQGPTTVGDAGVGTMSLSGATFSTSGTTVGSAAGSTGTFNVLSQGNLQVTGNCYIGDSGDGIFNVLSGGVFNLGNSTNQFGIGNAPGGAGYLTVADSGSVMNINSLCIVGVLGNGTAIVSNGASVYSSIAEIGSGSSSAGYLAIVGPGSSWVDGDSFIVGGVPSSGTGGNGVVYLTSQANLQVAGNCYIGGSGKANFYLNGGSSFTLTGSTRNFGVGDSSESVGYLNVSDPNSVLNVNSACIIGVLGTGVAVVSNGASVHSSIAEVGSGTGSSGSLTITGPGSSWVAGDSFYVGGAPGSTLGGTANVFLQNGGTLRAGPLFYVSSAGTVTIDSTSQAAVGTGSFGAPGTFRVTAGGKLFGKGRVQGQIVIAPGGKYLPGDSPGVFTVDGNLTVQTGGEVDIFIGGNTAGSGYSQINVTGMAAIGGTLNIILTNGYTPPPGQTFTILNAGAVSGNFDQVNGASITYGASGVTLSNVTGTTGTPQLSIQTEGQNVVVTWPETVQGYSLQTTPNLTSNGWSTVTAVENTYVAPSGTPQAFFRLVR